MTDLHITDPEPLNDDIVLENSLRPSKFDEFVGQNELVDNLKLYIEASNKRKAHLRSVLTSFYCPCLRNYSRHASKRVRFLKGVLFF